MATTDRPTYDEFLDRHSTAPHTAHVPSVPPPAAHRPRWALPLLAGLALATGGLTAVHMAWHGDQGDLATVAPTHTSERAAGAPPPASTTVVTSGEGDEDAPYPGVLPFDEYVAQKTLELRARGLRCARPGQVDLRVSFAPLGNSTRIEVVSDAANPVASCITSRFENVTIPPFQGREERSVNVSVAVR